MEFLSPDRHPNLPPAMVREGYFPFALKSACAGALANYRGQALAGACGWRLEGRHRYQLTTLTQKREFATAYSFVIY